MVKLNTMKKILPLFLFCAFVANSFAQLSHEQRIQDSIIGWWGNPQFDNRLKLDNTTLQKKKIATLDKFVEWMKKSYTPVGGLGDFTRYVNKNNYYVVFRVWNVTFEKEYLDAKGHFLPVSEENTPFRMSANLIPASYPVSFLNEPGKFFFTWPPDRIGSSAEDYKDMDPRIHPNVYKYITRVNEDVTIFLAPDNKLPFIPVSIGEYLNESDASLDRNFQQEKEKINKQWSDTKTREKVYTYKQKEFDQYRAAIAKWREKYKNKLNEPAVIHNMQPTIISEFFGDIDPFAISENEKAMKQYYPVFKLDAATMEKCKTDQPQWIAINLPYETKERGNQLFEMYTAVTQNLNYDYIYNYFFDPEKVKGIAYKPANEDQLNARLNNYRGKPSSAKNLAANTAPLPPNVFFMDDFSANTEGGDPVNWYFKTFGEHSTIATVKGQTGKWVKLGYNNPLSSTLMKKPLTENFTLEYDIVTDGEFSSSTGGAASLILNTRLSNTDGSENIYNNGTRVTINIVSGNEASYNDNNYQGNIKIDINSSPSVNKQNSSEGISYTYPIREFTNKKTKVHVAVKINDGALTVFINNKQVAASKDFKMAYGGNCISCGLPAGTKFNGVFWKNTTNDAENVKVYISNVRITKD